MALDMSLSAGSQRPAELPGPLTGNIIFRSSDWHGDDDGFRPMVLWIGRFES
jgi:hypothetical protein